MYRPGFGGKRKNKLSIGLPSIGKTYFIKKISVIIGENLKETIPIYLLSFACWYVCFKAYSDQ